ncbi:dockerin type I domain-containing protein [Stieleria sp. JC731]|uniref:choice-of-anchor Q domain-containing protein n=1 Tax=Pirellulaceae TaxID=2691357 RepID=UPI001E4F8B44|nr:choice-of-anchor Q domain-containing protein [Stieleria sp. JC731]MCC9601933.1 dockerin type I domain-containing protein [Stieleria sp. JC731]
MTSLREAIIQANSNGEDDTISLPSGTFSLSLTGSGEDAAETGDLDLTEANSLTIAGTGTTVIDASGLQDRVFDIQSGATVSLSGLTITGGVASDTAGAAQSSSGDGGAIYNAGDLSLTQVLLDGNTAAGASGSGGAVMNVGTFSASDSSIINNVANRAGGGIEDASNLSVSLTDVILEGNNAGVAPSATAAPGNGGGLHVTGSATVTITGGSVSDNVAAREGGGLWNGSGLMTIDGTTIANNVASGDGADDGGGGVFNNGGSVQIQNSLVFDNVADGVSGSGGGILNLGGSLAITSTTISGNTANRAGGGIEVTGGSVTTLDGVTLGSDGDGNNDSEEGNSVAENANPGNGGGLHIGGDGVVNITGGSVVGNVAGSEGGGLWNSSTGTLVVDGTLIDSNSAPTGGGVFNDGASLTSRTFTTTFVPLNDSGVSGTASVTVDTSSPMNPSISVSIDAAGLVPDQPHIQHIHGRFASDLDDNGDVPGPFLGSGGSAVSSMVPSANQDVNGDGFITVGEGFAAYGNVLLNLSDPQTVAPQEGESPLAAFDIDSFPTAEGGVIDFEMTYTFDLNDPDQARQYNNLLPMSLREIVLHGVNTDIDVDGDGSPDGYRVTGPAAAGTLAATGGTVTIANATISNNSASGDGGGIVNESGVMTITDTTITGNVSGGDEPGEGGGGIANFGGTLQISDSDITNNMAVEGLGNGGGIVNNDGGVLVVSGGTISGNSAARAGGGVENAGTATFESVEFAGNDTGINGGALHTSGPWSATFIDSNISSNTAGAEGGGLWNSGTGTMVITDSIINSNTASGDDADQGGGGVFNDGGTMIIGNSTISDNVADGTSGSGGGVLNLGGSLAITSTTISGNTANRAGGGIEVTDGSENTLSQVDLLNNLAGPVGFAAPGNGGGLHISGGGNLTITGGEVSGNTAASEGGGLWNGSGAMNVSGVTFEMNTASGTADDNGGGALFNNGGTLTVQDSTFVGNVADGPRGGGAGIMNVGSGSLTVVDSSFENNSAAGAMMGDGGGAILSTVGNVAITGSSYSGNTALGTSGSGGAILVRTGSLDIEESVFTANQANRAGGAIEIGAVTLQLTDVTLGGGTSAEGNSVAGSGASPGNGGGLHVTFDSDVSIVGGTVSNNSAVEGGGLWNSATGTMSVDGTEITSNIAIGDDADTGGGGVFNNGGELSILNADISNNSATGTSGSGGGLFNLGGEMTVESTVIAGNTANRAGGGIEVTSDSTTVLTDVSLGDVSAGSGNSVSDNANPGNGGGLHISGNGLVTIIGGQVSGNSAVEGGGLWNSPVGTLTVNGTTIAGNTAVRGGGVFNEDSTTGTFTLTNVLIDANTATGDETSDGGGGIHNLGTMSIVGSTITGNVASGSSGSGGGIANAGELSLTSTVLNQNIANRAGGAIEALDGSKTALNNVDMAENIVGPDGSASPGNGGAIHVSGAGNVSLIGGTVNNNTAAREGGGLWNGSGSMTIDGTTITSNVAAGDAADDGGGGVFNNGGTVSIVNSSITGNSATGSSGSGGGLFNFGGTALIEGSTFSGNISNRAGGGIEVTADSITTVLLSDLVSNTTGPAGSAAPGNGGGIHISGSGVVILDRTTVSGNIAANEGGGLWNSGQGTLDVRSSTVAENQSPDGAGIFSDEGSGTTLVTNSTIANNVASGGGGGIGAAGGSVNLTNATIAGNTAVTGGGIEVDAQATLTTINTIIATNTATTSPDVSGSLVSRGANLIGDSSGATWVPMSTDLVNVQAGLGNLGDNGGPTETIALLEGSPALAAGLLVGLTTDQRGVARPQGNGPDIGAFESDLDGANQNVAMLSISVAATNVLEGNITKQFTFTVTRTGNLNGSTTVDYAVAGSGSNPADANDFGGVFPTGTVSFADQESTKEVTISIAGDTAIEADESFQITLSNASENASITTGSVTVVLRDNDTPGDGTTQIIIPERLLGPKVIPGNNQPNAILFQASLDATLSVMPIGRVDLRETITILDGDLQQVSEFTRGTTSVDVQAGEFYAIIFEAQSMDRFYVIQSNRGVNSVANVMPTNILSATDTDGNGSTTPMDALRVINRLALQGEGELGLNDTFLDVNRDGLISPSDALQVINRLAIQEAGISGGEGEAVSAASMTLLPSGVFPSQSNDVEEESTLLGTTAVDQAILDRLVDDASVNDEGDAITGFLDAEADSTVDSIDEALLSDVLSFEEFEALLF